MSEHQLTQNVARPHAHSMRWGRRIGAVGFAFFLIKGLAWLMLPLLAYLARG